MRSRERLFEVIESLNPRVVGIFAQTALRIGANMIRKHGEIYGPTHDEICVILAGHTSPHVRELARELLALSEGRAP